MKRRTVAAMISKERIIQLSGRASVREASFLMAKEHVGAVMVTEGGRLEGVFTERDALNRVLAKGRDPETTRLSEVMTKNPMTVGPEKSAIEALRLMHDGGFRHLPVTAAGRLVGVISLRDFIGAELSAIEGEADIQARIAEGPKGSE